MTRYTDNFNYIFEINLEADTSLVFVNSTFAESENTVEIKTVQTEIKNDEGIYQPSTETKYITNNCTPSNDLINAKGNKALPFAFYNFKLMT